MICVAKIQRKSMDRPDRTMKSKGFRGDLSKLEGVTFSRMVLRPGWRWSTNMRPMVKTDSCMVHHTIYQISGVTHVAMDNGEEMEFRPGDVGIIPPGHDAWVVGNRSAVAIDFTGGADFSRPKKAARRR